MLKSIYLIIVLYMYIFLHHTFTPLHLFDIYS